MSDDKIINFPSSKKGLKEDLLDVLEKDCWMCVGVDNDGSVILVSSTQDRLEQIGLLECIKMEVAMGTSHYPEDDDDDDTEEEED